MSILVNPDALPQAIRAVFDMAKMLPGSTEEFSRLLVPHSHLPADEQRYRDGNGILRTALSEAESLGLIQSAGGTWTAAPEIVDDRTYRSVLRRAALREERFAAGIAWLLSCDAYRAPKAKTWAEYQREVPDVMTVISNDVQFINFRRWAVYLGFAREVAGWLMPDPTPALQDLWPGFVRSDEWDVIDLYALSCEALPVFPVASAGVLPSSMSLAFVALERRKACRLISHSDARKMTLTLPQGERAFSHVKVSKVKA